VAPSSPVIGYGLINKDYLAVVPAWERDQKAEATHFIEQVGGPVPVALMTMARLGCANIEFLGTVGEDRDGEHLCALLQEEGVFLEAFYLPNGPTSKSLVLLDARDGSRTLANFTADETSVSPWPADRRGLLSAACLLHLDGRDLAAALEAARIVREAGGTVSLDLGTMRPGREELVALCHIVLASRKGGAGAFPDVADDPAEQVRRFLALGPEIAGITLGAEGVVIGWRGQEPVHLPPYPIERVVDTCGAGDVFHGAFLWAHLDGRDPIACAHFAQAAAALRIQHLGNHAGIPTRHAAESFLQSHP
jgi:sugar/nucleoside kinase (ribokinase family)